MTKEIRTKISVSNNLILEKIEELGFASQRAFAHAYNVPYEHLNELIGMRVSPMKKNGQFTLLAQSLMEIFGCIESDLWTDEQLKLRLKKSSTIGKMTIHDVQKLISHGSEYFKIEDRTIDDEIDLSLLQKRINFALDSLTPREKIVLSKRFGLNEEDHETLEETGISLGLSGERIRCIETNAIRKLRNGNRRSFLKPFINENESTQN